MKYRYYSFLFRVACRLEAFAVRLRDSSQRRKMQFLPESGNEAW